MERVRARTMAMHRSDELTDVVKLLYQEFDKLKLSNVSTDIEIGLINEETGMAAVWAHLYLSDGTISTFDFPIGHFEGTIAEFKKWKSTPVEKRNELFFTSEFKGKFWNKFKKWIKKFPELAEAFQPMIEANITQWVTHNAYFSHGILTLQGIETYSPETLDIQKRFTKVFEQTYTRFLDLRKAEAQAKEAEIELALERIRARTMAMHASEELLDIIVVVSEQLQQLEIKFGNVSFGVNNPDYDLQLWMAVKGYPKAYPIQWTFIDNPGITRLKEAQRNPEEVFADVLSQAENNEWMLHVFKCNPPFDIFSDENRDRLLNTPGYARSIVIMKDIFLVIGNYAAIPYTDEENAIFKRFGNVFEQSYTRFLDLQKAEVQAREAQIEAALERVRASSMAMHQSKDLLAVIKVVTDQLLLLGFKFDTANFAKVYADGSWDLWLTTPEQKYPDLIHVPYLDHPIFNRIEDNIAKGLDFFTDAYEKNEANKFFRHFFENTIAKNAPESRKQFVLNSPGFARSLFSMKDLWLAIANYEGMPYTDAENLVFKRFAKVFEQAYTRFLDLQKAEAQAREAQIELGLERVRARAMAMHRSEELKELIATMSSELGRLDILLDRCFIIIYDQHTQGSTWWMANPETPTEPIGLQVQYHEHVPYLEHLEAWRQRKVKWEYILEGKVKKEWDQFLFVETELSQLPPPVIENMRSKKKVYLSSSFNNFGYLTLATLDPLTEQQFDIMLRFAKVFDLTYTRFNDLKQAEAQARESQIQLALERVRARTMAMQKAQELDAVIKTVYAELKQLDVSFDRCFIMIFDEKKGATWWMGSPEDDLFHEGFYVQYHAHPPHLAYLKGWEERQQKWEYWLGGQIKKDWDEFIFNKTGLSKLPSVAIEYMKSFESANLSAAFENFGCITTGGQERISEESYNILGRFAKVFDLTYTRFLDLQKAEAQAREAQIQLALERVRARAMAMQDPAEFVEVVNVMGKQFIYLGFDIEWANFGANGLDITNGIDTWNFAIIPGSDPVSSRLFIPWFDHPLFNDAKKQLDNYLDNGNDLFVMSYDKETKDRWLDHMFAQTIFKDVPDEYRAIQYEKPGYTTSNLALKDTWLSIGKFNTHSFTDEQHGILRRMGNAFGQAYTRFLDLQRAEAQARESQIQLALERVRARTMAMQRSDELPQAANLLFQQIQSLGMPTWSAGYCIWDDDKKAITLWMSSEGVIQPSLRMPLTEDPSLIHFLEAYQRGESFFVEEVGGEALRTHYAYLRTLPGVKETLDDIEKAGFPVPTFQIFHLAYFSKGFLLFITYQPVPEAHDIFKRFGKVFDQTYTRFLDLQRAEAQAREARIEISLERIRARALAMHSSDELMEVAKVLREQMALLGQRELESSVVHLYKLDPDHIHSWRAVSIAAESRSGFTYGHMAIPVNCCEVVREWLGKFNSDEQEYTLEISGAKQQEWYLILEKLAPEVVNSMRSENSLHEKRYYRFSKFSGGALLMISKQPPSEEAAYLQKRASVVFDLAYRRFSDLQKAEAQAREAQIEAALEKIRSRSLAMHQSEELQEVVNTVFERLNDLNIEIDSCNIAIFKERTKDWEYWIASPSQKRSAVFYMPYIDFGVTKDLVEAKEKGADFFTRSYRYEEKNEWFEYGFKNTDFKYLSEQRQKYILDAPAMTVGIAFAKYTGVQFNRYSFNKLTEGEIDILKRFAKVFEQAYIRFLDLQKAEAQAREAQIEAALERVRAKAMAMHKSDDLHAAVTIMFEEFQKLNLDVLRCGVGILDKNSRTGEIWATSISDSGIAVQISASESFDTHPLMSLIYESWQKQQDLDYVLQGQDLIDYYRAMKLSELKLPESQFALSEDDLQPQYYYGAMFKAGGLYSFRNKPFTDEDIKIMRRFASVVNLTYNRFIDLQKAEASAREAQIEAGLERVRARTMAMHSSEDVSAATATMFTELEKLGIENYRGGITNIFPDRTQEVWSVNNLAEGKSVKAVGRFNIDDHPFWQLMFHDWETKKDFTHYFLADDDKEEYIKVLNMTQGYLPQAFQQFPNVHFQVYYFNEGAVWTNSLHRHTDEEQQIMKRFASVFSLTFRRYQDLKKAEAQAKEATIEAALERVRGKAMAMHSSKDLATTIGVFYHELEGLNLTPRRCGVGLINKETWTAEISTMNATVDGQSVELVGVLDMRSHPILTGVYNNWLTKTEYHPVLRGNEIKEYYQLLRPQVAFPDYPADTAQYGYFFFFDEGGVYAWTEKELQEDELKIYRRFTSVLSLTYKRYKDLKDAELRAQNAVKEAALDRIRADIASMRTVEDLDRITPLIWNELKTLKVPFIRCGVFIMDDSQQFIHTFLSTPDGKAIAAFHLPYNTPGNIALVISNWRDKKKYIDHWKETEFRQFAEILVQQGALSSAGNYLKTIPHGGFFLHFLPFLQGMLYVGNTEKLNSEEIELIQHVADAFSTAYARYEDFNRLEAAKQQVDKTLVDLKQAQQQLVQSEKMASLGELTAGIAHEIQNPLNFVNNFSDVSNELLEEMKGELVTGNTQSAMEIVEDIKQNLEKILHHGKRADAIVKGMLQHSRTSSGQKEMTDINMLADEYLRLAYHGLRAKDKSFNAKFETHFDSNIGKVNVIPQDIGRVILNLINNAFYAVSEKQKYSGNARPDDPRLNDSVGQAGGRGYEPTVTVTTLKDNGRIEIKVKDNGNGIPQKNLDKIFQPFFTTKPTGQGTGLGLSLAYDIITKGHGGELKVETKEGEGTEFVISL
ncbi:MAG TPA: ATP-binding protein [Chitinophagaceae bacterium]